MSDVTANTHHNPTPIPKRSLAEKFNKSHFDLENIETLDPIAMETESITPINQSCPLILVTEHDTEMVANDSFESVSKDTVAKDSAYIKLQENIVPRVPILNLCAATLNKNGELLSPFDSSCETISPDISPDFPSNQDIKKTQTKHEPNDSLDMNRSEHKTKVVKAVTSNSRRSLYLSSDEYSDEDSQTDQSNRTKMHQPNHSKHVSTTEKQDSSRVRPILVKTERVLEEPDWLKEAMEKVHPKMTESVSSSGAAARPPLHPNSLNKKRVSFSAEANTYWTGHWREFWANDSMNEMDDVTGSDHNASVGISQSGEDQEMQIGTKLASCSTPQSEGGLTLQERAIQNNTEISSTSTPFISRLSLTPKSPGMEVISQDLSFDSSVDDSGSTDAAVLCAIAALDSTVSSDASVASRSMQSTPNPITTVNTPGDDNEVIITDTNVNECVLLPMGNNQHDSELRSPEITHVSNPGNNDKWLKNVGSPADAQVSTPPGTIEHESSSAVPEDAQTTLPMANNKNAPIIVGSDACAPSPVKADASVLENGTPESVPRRCTPEWSSCGQGFCFCKQMSPGEKSYISTVGEHDMSMNNLTTDSNNVTSHDATSKMADLKSADSAYNDTPTADFIASLLTHCIDSAFAKVSKCTPPSGRSNAKISQKHSLKPPGLQHVRVHTPQRCLCASPAPVMDLRTRLSDMHNILSEDQDLDANNNEFENNEPKEAMQPISSAENKIMSPKEHKENVEHAREERFNQMDHVNINLSYTYMDWAGSLCTNYDGNLDEMVREISFDEHDEYEARVMLHEPIKQNFAEVSTVDTLQCDVISLENANFDEQKIRIIESDAGDQKHVIPKKDHGNDLATTTPTIQIKLERNDNEPLTQVQELHEDEIDHTYSGELLGLGIPNRKLHRNALLGSSGSHVHYEYHEGIHYATEEEMKCTETVEKIHIEEFTTPEMTLHPGIDHALACSVEMVEGFSTEICCTKESIEPYLELQTAEVNSVRIHAAKTTRVDEYTPVAKPHLTKSNPVQMSQKLGEISNPNQRNETPIQIKAETTSEPVSVAKSNLMHGVQSVLECPIEMTEEFTVEILQAEIVHEPQPELMEAEVTQVEIHLANDNTLMRAIPDSCPRLGCRSRLPFLEDIHQFGEMGDWGISRNEENESLIIPLLQSASTQTMDQNEIPDVNESLNENEDNENKTDDNNNTMCVTVNVTKGQDKNDTVVSNSETNPETSTDEIKEIVETTDGDINKVDDEIDESSCPAENKPSHVRVLFNDDEKYINQTNEDEILVVDERHQVYKDENDKVSDIDNTKNEHEENAKQHEPVTKDEHGESLFWTDDDTSFLGFTAADITDHPALVTGNIPMNISQITDDSQQLDSTIFTEDADCSYRGDDVQSGGLHFHRPVSMSTPGHPCRYNFLFYLFYFYFIYLINVLGGRVLVRM